jgi:hypothetical protein
MQETNTTSASAAAIKVGELDFPPRKVWMKTYGCQMNYHDSERITSQRLMTSKMQIL